MPIDETIWRFLVVDDKQASEIEEFISENRVLEAPNRVIVTTCTNFKEAIEVLNESRIDLIILDLKDETSIRLEDDETPLAGEVIFEQIRTIRFIPVVFYTAFAHKVKHLMKPYVRVVERGNAEKLRSEILEVFQTGLPKFIRHIEIEQREYLWKHMDTHWVNPDSSYDKTDLTYLLARRLANILERNSIRKFLKGEKAAGPEETDNTVYPIEMYIYPSTNLKLRGGDILKGEYLGKDGYWVVITPSCDLEQDKVSHVVLAACVTLADQPELKKIYEAIKNKQAISDTSKKELAALIGNNRQAKNIQAERYNFLPGTFFIPDLMVDFQELITVPLAQIATINRIASLDSPFAESCLARFTRYYGRLGIPDVDKDFVTNKIVEAIKKNFEVDDSEVKK